MLKLLLYVVLFLMYIFAVALYLMFLSREVKCDPVASLSSVPRSGIVIVAHATGAPLDPSPGPTIDDVSVDL